MHSLQSLHEKIINCTRCPRLVYFRKHAPERKAFKNQIYWRKPVCGFGDPNGWLLILGMAPAAQGANRTGRIFTGDASARFLMRALFLAGFANQPTSETVEDHLTLKGCYLTAAVKCAPPANHPSREEFANCSSYFENELFLLKKVQAILALGKLAFDSYQRFLKKEKIISSLTPFSHAKQVCISGWPTLYGSYHPSPQNTYTKKLTEKMFVKLLDTIKEHHK